jgi:predicted ArsR family transcriptional regulator
MGQSLDDAVRLAGVLEEPLRRHLYSFVRRADHPVTRDEAAEDAGISRKLAAFHLDKLVERGLLRASFARPPGRSGRGAGRPAKRYEPSDVSIEMSIPERRYAFVGDLLVDAIREASPEEPATDAASRVSWDAGFDVGRSIRKERRLRPPGPERALAVTHDVLERHGFEPVRDGDRVWLRNCPFQALAQKAPDLVCVMNRSYIDGLVRGLGNERLDVVLDRAPGRCCVQVQVPPADQVDDRRLTGARS